MRQGLHHSTSAKQTASLKVDPKVVLGSQLLQMSQVELEQAIRTELQENPALEWIDDFDDPVTFEEILSSVAPSELKPSSSDHEFLRSLPQDSQSQDWLDFTASADSLWDHLLAQLRSRFGGEHGELVTYFVGSVNDRGYLTCDVEDAALDCNALLEDAETVFRALRECEPAGVGARDLRDCLFLQLRNPSTDAEMLARLMVKRNWDDLVSRNKRAVCRAFGADEELVDQAFEVISGLNPFPGEFYSSHEGAGSSEKVSPALPDVVITMDQTGFLVEVPGPSPIHLRISHAYLSRKETLDDAWVPDAAEKRHVNEFIGRAQRFLDALTQRRQQMARLGKYLIEHQGGFVKTGEYKFLVPLTRSQVAKDLGVHESTISRATSGKFIQIVNGDVVNFEVFFKPALRVQKMIEEILETENPDSPMSDERIAQMLEAKGVKVARRTVNKYRDRTKLLSSRLRKTG